MRSDDGTGVILPASLVDSTYPTAYHRNPWQRFPVDPKSEKLVTNTCNQKT
jgi:hypothetical protein